MGPVAAIHVFIFALLISISGKVSLLENKVLNNLGEPCVFDSPFLINPNCLHPCRCSDFQRGGHKLRPARKQSPISFKVSGAYQISQSQASQNLRCQSRHSQISQKHRHPGLHYGP